MGQTNSSESPQTTQSVKPTRRGLRTLKPTARSKSSECEGYVLTEDIQEYADDLRKKMDFINGDSTSTAEKMNELKKVLINLVSSWWGSPSQKSKQGFQHEERE